MDARYKILFSGEFKDWVEREEFIRALSQHLGVSEGKAAALFEVNRKVNLKKNLSEIQADRHMAAFEKMGMLVTKRLMMKPFVGPCIERESRVAHVGGRPQLVASQDKADEFSGTDSGALLQGKRGLSGLTRGLKSLIK
jgi:hypothetical protein